MLRLVFLTFRYYKLAYVSLVLCNATGQSEPSKRVRVTFFESSKPLAVTSPDPSDLLDLLDAPVGSVMTSSSPVPDSAPPYDRQARFVPQTFCTIVRSGLRDISIPVPPPPPLSTILTKSNRGVDAPRPEALGRRPICQCLISVVTTSGSSSDVRCWFPLPGTLRLFLADVNLAAVPGCTRRRMMSDCMTECNVNLRSRRKENATVTLYYVTAAYIR
uniref:Secreted protein n=1 Tax=Timema bartmani TaxID=61472 RepID=A0A7R9EVF4_9NEOP|nr:unnamed protein product [Timema bartmani]